MRLVLMRFNNSNDQRKEETWKKKDWSIFGGLFSHVSCERV